MKKILFAVDLDGTVLSDSQSGDIHPITIKAIKRATKEGHIVCILTGRPWRGAKTTYKKLGLETVIVNYNGAYIHHPVPDSEFLPTIKYLNLNDVLYILGNEKIKSVKENLAIEGPGWVTIEKRDHEFEHVFGMDLSNNLRVGIQYHKVPLKPTGVVIDVKKGVDDYNLVKYLRRRYGDLCLFTSWSKGEGKGRILDIIALGAQKEKALPLLARYYDIDINNTIAIGDDHNDKGMIMMAGIGVAMKNGNPRIKKIATTITKYNNDEGGVGHYINSVLDDLEKTFKIMKERWK